MNDHAIHTGHQVGTTGARNGSLVMKGTQEGDRPCSLSPDRAEFRTRGDQVPASQAPDLGDAVARARAALGQEIARPAEAAANRSGTSVICATLLPFACPDPALLG